jgi:PmbA protein
MSDRSQYQDLAAEVVRRARKLGADHAEVMIRSGTEFTAAVRMGEIDTLSAAVSKAMGVRVFKGKKKFLTYTSDFDLDAIDRVVRESLALAELTGDDDANGLPAAEELADAATAPDLALHDAAIDAIPTEKRVAMALAAEKAAFDFDPRITNSAGADFSSADETTVLANSLGFAGTYRESSVSLSVSPVVAAGGKKQTDYWFSRSRRAADLAPPAEVGREAARRVLRRLDPLKPATRAVPVVLDPLMAAGLVRMVFMAASGDMVWRKQTFLADRLGQAIASDLVTIVDDPLRPGELGSRPFDAEGVRSRQNVIIERGVLRQFLTSTYSARRLGGRSTGNASRGVTAEPGVGPSNLYLEPGPHDPEELIASVADGLYVTNMMGFGVNMVKGDFSRGAAGIWIENGKLTRPVAEITIAGNMNDILKGIVMVGNDIHHDWGSVRAPSLKIATVTVSGA